MKRIPKSMKMAKTWMERHENVWKGYQNLWKWHKHGWKDMKMYEKDTKIYENGINMYGKTWKYMKRIPKSMQIA
jgi:uncharacterized GH25 family protein